MRKKCKKKGCKRKLLYGSISAAILMALVTAGCSDRNTEQKAAEGVAEQQKETAERISEELIPVQTESETTQAAPETSAKSFSEALVKEMDCRVYFGDLSGAAVLWNPGDGTCLIYQKETAETRNSPCSTFKIVSSLAGMEHGVISKEESIRKWSGEYFWNEAWNRDTDFPDAFRNSCIWYFREVIDELGPEIMSEELEALQYGNCDISDWSGQQRSQGKSPALTGFWVESSLMISPVEQVQVMERIFGNESTYNKEHVGWLEEVMKLTGQETKTCTIYGKTGLGRKEGGKTDAWYTGFADTSSGRIFFCTYLGDDTEKLPSSQKAKELSVQIIESYENGQYR